MVEKKIVSYILKENKDWHNVNDIKPESNQRVVIRFYSPNMIYKETEEEIVYVEEAKIGRYIRDINNPEFGRFVIDPPYPLFDYSPLSNNGDISDEAIITHWAAASKEELYSWDNRYAVQGEYDNLEFRVDAEHLELAYRAFMWAAAFIRSSAEGEDAEKLVCFLDDLATLMDKQTSIIDGREVGATEMAGIQNPPIEETLLMSLESYYSNIMNIKSYNDLSPNMVKMLSIKSQEINKKLHDLSQEFLSSKCKLSKEPEMASVIHSYKTESRAEYGRSGTKEDAEAINSDYIVKEEGRTSTVTPNSLTENSDYDAKELMKDSEVMSCNLLPNPPHYNPYSPDHQIKEQFWGIPYRKYAIAIICNQFNKILFEEDKEWLLIQLLHLKTDLDVKSIRFDCVRQTPSLKTQEDVNNYVDSKPRIFTFIEDGKPVRESENRIAIESLNISLGVYPIIITSENWVYIPCPEAENDSARVHYKLIMDFMTDLVYEYFGLKREKENKDAVD